MRDFDDNEFPLAYLITFRCYGTWLHGDGLDLIVVVPKSGPFAFRHDRASLRRRLNNSSIFPFNSKRVSGRLSKTLFERSVFIADIRCMPSTQERIMCTQSYHLTVCLSRFWRRSNRTQHARSEQMDWIRTSSLGHDMAVLSICGKNGT